ncbi:hypothetical protein GCM10028822_30380 [Hymenobacter terrigena]
MLAGPVAAQVFTIPPGAYRTGAAYHRKQPQPAGLDAFYPDKRGQLVVVVPRGSKTAKLRVAPDSVWGYVSGKGRTSRLFRNEEYRLEYADTLCVYTQNSTTVNAALGGNNGAGTRYFFSRGLTGLIFPLTTRYIREAYEASNPEFIAAVGKLGLGQSLVDFDRKTGLFRVTTLYRESATH